ncbi:MULTISPECIES: DNA-3-methyladenine glycosylase I [Prosthecochloris]|uniref:DNA-3-methyladenine glycosylase I n=1 Tax=Prosthecochloris marina TaxID=2017681 RepID=A0A317T654_9CHLB|nr:MULTISPECIES: DNA-3-methyladenine glycosylase I [Prosthecochloris]PWW82088.1 DNA-3-methyladenine glycosylase I [Prosthecochloris marina]UZJ36770.1 DNA-3-methyladenine glycosylase I [Prosthecochloris sp. SCSIO W1103]UZJ39708.1 DNA-3-methyladenine glycosylase I [Prosthecochloris sp. SCSIO W1102]
MKKRCGWCGDDPLYVAYHDKEWGVPVFDDRKLFEMLVLEGAQAGLSWITILRKRENYRQAFDRFSFEKVAGYTEHDVGRLLGNPGIVRNRRKIESTIRNAQGVLAIQERHGSFASFVWDFVDGKPIQNQWRLLSDVPAFSKESDRMNRELKRLGFSFVGSTICYAFMQAVGMVNDHVTDCFRHREVRNTSSSL